MSSVPPSGSDPDRATQASLRASSAEREATRRISDAHTVAAQAEKEAREKVDSLKDEYQRQSMAESARQEAAIENTRQKGYRNVREQQRAFQSEAAKTRRAGDEDLTNLKNHYRDAIYATKTRNDQDLDAEKMNHSRALEFEQASARQEVEAAQKENTFKFETMRAEHDERLQNLTAAERKEYEDMKAKTAAAKESAREHFESTYQKITGDQQKTLDRVNREANANLIQTKLSTGRKLDAYASRQSDPFYKMMDLDATVQETSDAYILRASIPNHERDSVVVSIKGDNLVISGTRKNEENHKAEDGTSQGTSSYQSYFRSFPVTWPLDSKGMSREYNGDELIVTIPKKTRNDAYKPYAAKRPETVRAERPRFPANLPYQDLASSSPGNTAGKNAALEAGSGEPATTDEGTFVKRRGGQTLS